MFLANLQQQLQEELLSLSLGAAASTNGGGPGVPPGLTAALTEVCAELPPFLDTVEVQRSIAWELTSFLQSAWTRIQTHRPQLTDGAACGGAVAEDVFGLLRRTMLWAVYGTAAKEFVDGVRSLHERLLVKPEANAEYQKQWIFKHLVAMTFNVDAALKALPYRAAVRTLDGTPSTSLHKNLLVVRDTSRPEHPLVGYAHTRYTERSDTTRARHGSIAAVANVDGVASRLADNDLPETRVRFLGVVWCGKAAEYLQNQMRFNACGVVDVATGPALAPEEVIQASSATLEYGGVASVEFVHDTETVDILHSFHRAFPPAPSPPNGKERWRP